MAPSAAFLISALILGGVYAQNNNGNGNGVYINNASGGTIYYALRQKGDIYGPVAAVGNYVSAGIGNSSATGGARITATNTDAANPPALYLEWDGASSPHVIYDLASQDGASQPFINTLRLLTPMEGCTQLNYTAGQQVPGGDSPPSETCAEGTYLVLSIDT